MHEETSNDLNGHDYISYLQSNEGANAKDNKSKQKQKQGKGGLLGA